MVEAQFFITARPGDIVRFKNIIPDRKGKAKVYAIPVGNMFGMVPDVHLGIVEYVFQRTQRHPDIAVVKMTDGQGKDMDDQEVLHAEADHGQGDVFQGTVNDRLHPVVTEVGGEAHFLDAVMHLVKLPEPFRPVQQPVHIPLNKIADDKQNAQLNQPGQLMDPDGHQVFPTESPADEIVEGLAEDIGNRVVPDQGKKEKIKEHVKAVQPEILSDGRLVFPPGEGDFEQPEKQGNPDQPIKIIVPGRIQDFIPEVIRISRITVDEGFPVFHLVGLV